METIGTPLKAEAQHPKPWSWSLKGCGRKAWEAVRSDVFQGSRVFVGIPVEGSKYPK